MIKIPGELGWLQNNRSDGLGSIQSSFNLDLSSNTGKVRTTRAKRLAYTGSPTGFGQVVAIERFLRDFFVAAEASGDDIWQGGNSPYDTINNDASSIEITPARTDMLAWNAGLYATAVTEMYYSTNGTSWTEIGANVLTGNGGLLAAKGEVLYVSDERYKVKSVTSGNTFQGTGAQTLDLDLAGYHISVLMAGLDSMWVGLTNRDGGGQALMFEWDGETENTPTARYEIEASGLMAGVAKDGVPYIVDSRGRLLVWNGGVFTELARFPLKSGSFRGFNDDTYSGRAIHPRGMAVDVENDEILITVASATDGLTTDDFNEFPSGVWAYSERAGLYHKYSPSYQAKGDTGTTNLTDFGQVRCLAGGPMMVFEAVDDGTTDNAGRVVFSMEYFTDADSGTSDTEWGLFADDTNDTTQKGGWLVTPRILSQNFRDHWQKVYAAISDLETAGDLVEVKYRVKDESPTYITGTWESTTRFGTPTDLAGFEQGDELTIMQGKGAGAVVHIAELEPGANSGVTLDRAITGVVAGQTSIFKIEKWRRVGSVSDIADQGFTIGESDHWIQVKLYLQWTGARELYGIIIENTSSLS